jgi:hypothetical protein
MSDVISPPLAALRDHDTGQEFGRLARQGARRGRRVPPGSGAGRDRRKTVEAFKAIDPDYIIPMHCTGLNTIFAVQREMPKKLVMPSTGTRVIFGS